MFKNAGVYAMIDAVQSQNIEQLSAAITVYGHAIDSENPQRSYRPTPMHDIVQRNWREGLSLLLTKGSKAATIQDRRGYLPLHVAAECGYYTCVEMLLKASPMSAECCASRCSKGETPLIKAVRRGCLRSTRAIIFAHPECINVVDNDGRTAISHAILCGQTEAFNELLQQKDVVVTHANRHGQTLIHEAANAGNFTIFCAITAFCLTKGLGKRILLKKDNCGLTIYDYATTIGDSQKIQVLNALMQ